MAAEAQAITSEFQPAETWTQRDKQGCLSSLYLFNVGKGLVLGLGGGRQDRKEGRYLWPQPMPDGNSTVQLPQNAQLWPFLATGWYRPQPTLAPELLFCKDREGERTG